MKLPPLGSDGAEGAGTRAASGSRPLDEKEIGSLVKTETDAMLLRAEEVSRLLQIGRTLTFQLIADGDLPVVRIGRAVRVPRSELERWIRERTMSE
jgi:excisionase family DNA binding protein